VIFDKQWQNQEKEEVEATRFFLYLFETMKRLTIYTGIRKRSTTEILVQVRVKSAKEEE